MKILNNEEKDKVHEISLGYTYSYETDYVRDENGKLKETRAKDGALNIEKLRHIIEYVLGYDDKQK